MRALGLLLVLLGMAGLSADRVVAVPPDLVEWVRVGSWAVGAVGTLLMLFRIARSGAGFGVFPLACGVGLLVAQPITHWMDGPAVQAWQPWLGFGLVLLIGGGALRVMVTQADNDPESASFVLALFAFASLITDIVVDFGDWDGLLNVSTAAFTAAFAFVVVIKLTALVEAVDGPGRRELIAGLPPDPNHPLVRYLPMVLTRLWSFGLAVAAVPVTVMLSFDLPVFVDVLLTLPATLGVYTGVALVGYRPLAKAIGPERLVRAGQDAIGNVLDADKYSTRLLKALTVGYGGFALLVETVVLRPPVWLVGPLAIMGFIMVVNALWRWKTLMPQVVAEVIRESESPERTAPSIAELLGRLGRADPVFRLLPGSERLAPGAKPPRWTGAQSASRGTSSRLISSRPGRGVL